MGCCLSCLRNIFYNNIKKKIISNNISSKKNNVQNSFKKNNKHRDYFDKKYLNIIKNNYDNNIETDEESYILIRIKLNEKKDYNYIKTDNYIKYNEQIVKKINRNPNLLNIEKYENIFILEDKYDLYTRPPSPYITNKLFYEPDYSLNTDKQYEFNYKLNKIIKNLYKIVKEKRIKFDNEIKNINI